MKKLFRISTDQFTLEWNQVSQKRPAVLSDSSDPVGHFKVSPRSKEIQLSHKCWKALPKQLSGVLQSEIGPALFEQTDYQIYLKGNKNYRVDLHHRDPNIRHRLSHQENGRVLHGVINFRGQIGRSRFTITVNGLPALDFEVEVFPTKIDYETDYKEIVADIQSILTSLAYEYLRSTFQLGKSSKAKKPTRLEWLMLLRNIVDELEKAVSQIAHQPKRQLVREPRINRIERIKRIDSSIRSQIRRGKGRGQFVETAMGKVRERLVEQPTKSTLDTMEHRWLKRQLVEIQRDVAQILAECNKLEQSKREKATQRELLTIERRVSRMSNIEPFRDANGNVPHGFASLQLISAPGYREAYQLCLLLKTGLRLEGEALRLNVKDLNVLYEYWAFLVMLRIMRDQFGSPVDLSQMFRVRQKGIGVKLTAGRQQAVPFKCAGDRRITVTYNPKFEDQDTTLIPQKPDILISFEEKNWPRIQLICDAKYRVDASEEYRRQYKSFGPPSDAINVLHRYRDAILEFDRAADTTNQPERSVIQAAALFPFSETTAGEYRESRLWQSIDKFGIGAIPALPSNLTYLTEWLTNAVREGGWSLADRVIPHFAEQKAIDWRVAASEPVLVGVLSSKNPQERLDWIRENRVYYHPLPKGPKHRHFYVKQVALFLPKTLTPNGITHVANVRSIEVENRGNIFTPWDSHGPTEQRFLVYHLSDLRLLKQPIENTGEQTTTFRRDRWTTRLGLERAQVASDIVLETDAEWKLREFLIANCLEFVLTARSINIAKEAVAGHAVFGMHNGSEIIYNGANRFTFRRRNASASEALSFIEIKKMLQRANDRPEY